MQLLSTHWTSKKAIKKKEIVIISFVTCSIQHPSVLSIFFDTCVINECLLVLLIIFYTCILDLSNILWNLAPLLFFRYTCEHTQEKSLTAVTCVAKISAACSISNLTSALTPTRNRSSVSTVGDILLSSHHYKLTSRRTVKSSIYDHSVDILTSIKFQHSAI